MYTISLLGPLLLSACADGILSNFVGNRNGLICNLDQSKPEVIQYSYNTEKSCYKDGVFYPRCKDLENPEVLRYHNLLYVEK